MSILRLLQVLINGQASKPVPKHDLRKQTTSHNKNFSKINMNMNYNLLFLVVIIFLTIMFFLICFYMTGASMVESGTYYNNIDAVI